MKQNKIPRNEYIRKPVGKTNPYKHDVDYVSAMGYRDDSPFNDRPYIDIHTPSGMIDMSNTGIPLMANGMYLSPYSGMHQFEPGIVREQKIPMAQKGYNVIPNVEYVKGMGSQYDPIMETIYIDSEDPEDPEKLLQHEMWHHYQNYNNYLRVPEDFPTRKRPQTPSTDEAFQEYYNRKKNDVEQISRGFRERYPDFKFVPDDVLYNKAINDIQYDQPWTMEGEGRAAESPEGIEFLRNQGYDIDQYKEMLEKAKNKKAYGGGLLNKTLTCSSCGWSWKAVDGGKDIATCHKCGGTAKLAYGGNPSLPNIEDHYPFGGQNTKTHTHMVQGGGLNDLPKAQDGLFNTLYAKLNPYNWGVPDYSGSDELGKWDWSTANYVARDRGDKEFMHNNKRYAVKDKRKKEDWETAEEKNPEFFKNYALNYFKKMHPKDYEKRYKDLLNSHYRYGNPDVTIEKPGSGYSNDYGRAYFNNAENQMHIYGLHQNPNITKIDTANLMGDYAQELLHARQLKDLGEKGFSKHIQEDLKRNNVHYEPSTKKWVNYDETMYTDPKSIEGVHYTQGNALWDRLMWRNYHTEEDPDKKEDRDYYLNYYKNRKFHPYEDQNNLRTLQKALSEAGYDMSESLKKDGTYDGIYGEQTKNALYNWQKGYTPTPVKKSNVTISAAPTYNKKYGGWLDKLQKGGRTPIYVNDPNDHRLKAYSDSLSWYNHGMDGLRRIMDGTWSPDIPANPNPPFIGANKFHQQFAYLRPEDRFYPGQPRPIGYFTTGNMVDTGDGVMSDSKGNNWGDEAYYKKPTQPVIYKDPAKATTPKTLKRTLTPIKKKEVVPQEMVDYLPQKQMSLPTQQQEPELRIPTTPKDTTAGKRIAWRQDPNTKKMVPVIGGMKEKVKDMKRLYNKYIPSSGGAIPADFIPDYGDVVTFQNGGLLDKMQKGGRTPIVVDDKNNPKLKSYTDSLALYNLSQKAKKLFDVDPMDPTLEGYNKKANALASKSKIKPTKLQLSGYSQDYPKNFDPGAMEEPWMVTYKKPVQPYIYKKPEEKEQSRTDVYTDKALFDKAYKAEMDSINVRKTADQTFKPGNKTRPLTNKEKEEWKDKQTGLYPNVVEYNPAFPGSRYFGHFKKPVVHNVYEEPVKEQSKKAEPKKTEAKKDYATRNVDFSSPYGPVMKYYDAAGKVIRTEPYVLPQQKNGGWLDQLPKAQEGNGQTFSEVEKEQIEDNKNFLKEMAISPLFEERWAKMTGKDPNEGIKYDRETNPSDYQEWILDNLDKVKHRTNPKTLAKEHNLGMYIPDTHKILQGKEYNSLTDLHELSHASTRGELKFNKPYTYSPGIGYNSLYTEAYGPHKGFKTYKDYIEDFYGKEDNKKYYSDPTEIKARVDYSRRVLQKEGSYDPIKSRFEEKDYNNLKKHFEENSDIKELLMNYSKDDVIRMMNDIVSNNPQSQPVAKMGGWLDELDDEYRRGGMINPLMKSRSKRSGTSKNIQSSINKIFLRNHDIFGPGGKNIYNPKSKYQDGGLSDAEANYLNRKAYEESLAQARKDYVNDFVKQGTQDALLNSPFNLAAGFTPAGAAIFVGQSGAQAIQDVANKDYLSAGINAAFALPLLKPLKQIKALKGLPKGANTKSIPKGMMEGLGTAKDAIPKNSKYPFNYGKLATPVYEGKFPQQSPSGYIKGDLFDLTRSGYTDVPGFNQELNYLKARAQYGKRPLETKVGSTDAQKVLARAEDIPYIGNDMPNVTYGQYLNTDLMPGKLKKYTAKEAFQQLIPNKYGGQQKGWLDKYNNF